MLNGGEGGAVTVEESACGDDRAASGRECVGLFDPPDAALESGDGGEAADAGLGVEGVGVKGGGGEGGGVFVERVGCDAEPVEFDGGGGAADRRGDGGGDGEEDRGEGAGVTPRRSRVSVERALGGVWDRVMCAHERSTFLGRGASAGRGGGGGERDERVGRAGAPDAARWILRAGGLACRLVGMARPTQQGATRGSNGRHVLALRIAWSMRPARRNGVLSARPLGVFVALGSVLVPLTLGGCLRNDEMAGARFTGDESLFDLVQFGDTESPQELINAAMNQFNADDRARGITRIATREFGADPVFVELYRLGVADGDAAVRAAAARALGLHGSAEDAQRVGPLLTDEDQLVRWQAAIALQRLHDPLLVEALIDRMRLANEPDVQVRAAAATALGQYEQRRVLDALVAALDDPDLAVNDAARESLRTLTGQRELGYLPREWVVWLRAAEEPFADREEFVYPAFNREVRWWEHLNPFYEVPNEMAARPAGMPAVERR